MTTPDLSKLQIESGLRSTKTAGSRRVVVWGVIVATLSAILLWAALTGRLLSPQKIQTGKAQLTFVSRALTILNASGYVVAQRKAAVSSKATGRIEKLFVEEGAFVREGDMVAQLENKDLQATDEEANAAVRVANAALTNAEAELQDAVLNFNRQKSLRESGAVSVQAFDSADARFKKAVASHRSAQFAVDRASASVKVAQVNLEYSFIRAPFAGMILTKNADVGEVVAPFGAATNAKAAVVTMADMNSLMVEVDVSEVGIAKIQVGGAAEIRLDAFPDERFPGTVHMIVPTADRAKATVLTKVAFNRRDTRVLPEMSAKVAFLSRPLAEGEDRPFLGAPAASVVQKGQDWRVFVVKNSVVEERKISIGRRWPDFVEALSGLKDGELIALNPEGLSNGTRVVIEQ